MKTQRKIKTPLALQIIGWAFPKVERIAPWFAKKWFVKIFFGTSKYKVPEGEAQMAELATKYQIDFQGKKIQVYEWGEGKPVLFVHGWMGRATQFRNFYPAFANAGYKVVSFDSTGHGKSEGSSSHLMEFVGIIERLQQNYRQFEMIVGHSLGGVASFHAALNGITDRLVMISSPTVGAYITEEFRKKLRASSKMVNYFNEHIERKYGRSFESYSVSYNINKLNNVDLLLIHDEDDKEVDIFNAELIKHKYPSAKLITTSGNGHTRILKNEMVVNEVLGFVSNTKHAEVPELISA